MQVKLYKPTTNYGRAKAQQSSSFKPSMEDDVIQVYMVWGLKNQNRSRCNPHANRYVCAGNTVWDEGFDLNPAPSQMALKVGIQLHGKHCVG